IRYRKVDAETGDEVDSAEIIKGYEVGKGQYIEIEPEELEAIAIESKRTIEIDEFVPKKEIDELYLNSPYYLAPDAEVGQQAFAVSHLFHPSTKERIVSDHEPVCSQLHQSRETRIQFAFGTRLQDFESKPEPGRGRPKVAQKTLAKIGTCWIDKCSNNCRCRQQLVQQFKPLGPYLRSQCGYAGQIATRPIEARDQSKFNRIAPHIGYD